MEQLHAFGQKNYIYQVFRSGVTFPSIIFDDYPNLHSYMCAFVSFQVVLERRIPRSTQIIIKLGSDTIFQMQEDCNYDMKCMKQESRRQLANPTYPIVKFNTWLRRRVWPNSTREFEMPEDSLHPLICGIRISIWCFTSASIRSAWFLLLLVQVLNQVYFHVKQGNRIHNT